MVFLATLVCLFVSALASPICAQAQGIPAVGAIVPNPDQLGNPRSLGPQDLPGPGGVPPIPTPPPGGVPSPDPTSEPSPGESPGVSPSPGATIAPVDGGGIYAAAETNLKDLHSCDLSKLTAPSVLENTIGHSSSGVMGQMTRQAQTFIEGSFTVAKVLFGIFGLFAFVWFVIKVVPTCDTPVEFAKTMAFKVASFTFFIMLIYAAAGAVNTGKADYASSAGNQISTTFITKVLSVVSGGTVSSSPSQTDPVLLATQGGCMATKFVQLPLYVAIKEMRTSVHGNFFSAVGQLGEALVMMLLVIVVGFFAAVLALIAYLILAGNLFMLQFNALLIVSAGVFMLGFSGSPWTMPYAQAYWGYVWTNAIQTFTLMLIATFLQVFTSTVMGSVADAADKGIGVFFQSIIWMILALVIMALLAYHGPKLASSFLSGAPGMEFADAANSVHSARKDMGRAIGAGAASAATALLGAALTGGIGGMIANKALSTLRNSNTMEKPSSTQHKEMTNKLDTNTQSQKPPIQGQQSGSKPQPADTNVPDLRVAQPSPEAHPSNSAPSDGDTTAENQQQEGTTPQADEYSTEQSTASVAEEEPAAAAHQSETPKPPVPDEGDHGALHAEKQPAGPQHQPKVDTSATGPRAAQNGSQHISPGVAAAISSHATTLAESGAHSAQHGDSPTRESGASQAKSLQNIAKDARGLASLASIAAGTASSATPHGRAYQQRAQGIASALNGLAKSAASLAGANPAARALGARAIGALAQGLAPIAASIASGQAEGPAAAAQLARGKDLMNTAISGLAEAPAMNPAHLAPLAEASQALGSASSATTGADAQQATTTESSPLLSSTPPAQQSHPTPTADASKPSMQAEPDAPSSLNESTSPGPQHAAPPHSDVSRGDVPPSPPLAQPRSTSDPALIAILSQIQQQLPQTPSAPPTMAQRRADLAARIDKALTADAWRNTFSRENIAKHARDAKRTLHPTNIVAHSALKLKDKVQGTDGNGNKKPGRRPSGEPWSPPRHGVGPGATPQMSHIEGKHG